MNREISEPVIETTERAPRQGMCWIPGATFRMGSENFYPEERPVHRVRVDGFWMDATPVTNAQFRAFVEATGYRTYAEIPPRAEDYPGALPEMLHPGSLVFMKPEGPVPMRMEYWWNFVLGADWRHPLGPDSTLEGLDDHPVVHVALRDVEAYAAWAGKRLPTEAEWELAARGGLDQADYAWGDTLMPGGKPLANFWQGQFPFENTLDDGYERTSPVGTFPPNPFGLVDMIGNTWEWTQDWYEPGHPSDAQKACCVPSNPRGGAEQASYASNAPGLKTPRKVLKGGSHLCAKNYCQRYRPAARFPHPVDTSTSHVGFRCVASAGPNS